MAFLTIKCSFAFMQRLVKSFENFIDALLQLWWAAKFDRQHMWSGCCILLGVPESPREREAKCRSVYLRNYNSYNVVSAMSVFHPCWHDFQLRLIMPNANNEHKQVADSVRQTYVLTLTNCCLTIVDKCKQGQHKADWDGLQHENMEQGAGLPAVCNCQLAYSHWQPQQWHNKHSDNCYCSIHFL